MSMFGDGLDKAVQKAFTRPIPKSACAQMRYLVKQLKGTWLTRLGSGRGTKYYFEADPLVIDGVLYIPTGNDDIYALDGKTGRKLWEYSSDIPQTNDLICCGWDNRGVAAGV